MPNPLAGSKFYARLGNIFTRPLWSLRAPSGFGIITTTGRKSGRPRRQSVRAIRRDDEVYVVAMMGKKAAWLRNVNANPRITIKLGSDTLRGTADEISDPGQKQRARDIWAGTVVMADYVDYLLYHWDLPTRSKIIRAHERWLESGIPICIRLDATSASPSS